MQVGVGYSNLPDITLAANSVVQQAVKMSGRNDLCDMALLFCTSHHNQQLLYKAVTEALGGDVPIYGGGAAGVITNNNYGYAGEQVGIACIWLDGASYDVFIGKDLSAGNEAALGRKLGKMVVQAGADTKASYVLFYDAIDDRKAEYTRLNMATWILDGFQEEIDFTPNLVGAGIIGNHQFDAAGQFIGSKADKNCAIMMAFSEDVQITSTILHGCRPASEYYTVTKTDGPVILEINNKPALDFMEELIGPETKPEAYPFFLLLGVNLGEHRDEYDESKYASRLCLGIDRERKGIIMFEPDMVAGTEFQLMFRSFTLEDYMKPRINALFDSLGDREPVFALYINCAGRCAGYSGTDLEDALVVQAAVADRVPILGLYTGVEIATIAGKPRGLDWTGVFCLFTQNRQETALKTEPIRTEQAHLTCNDTKDTKNSAEPETALQKLCKQNFSQILHLDSQTIKLRYELEIKRRGFNLISDLALYLRQPDDHKKVFTEVAKRINSVLNMEKTLILLHNEPNKSSDFETFFPTAMHGFLPAEYKRLYEIPLEVPGELTGFDPVLVTGELKTEQYTKFREMIALPYFISSPILLREEVAALLITGRLVEQPPYLVRLTQVDLETVYAITTLLSSILVNFQFRDLTRRAETDGLTALKNRNSFQRQVENHLKNNDAGSGAFMMIDADHFKAINDTYGHIVGDNVLRDCADALRAVFRDSDLIGRQGGDEFAVFCPGVNNKDLATKKAAEIANAWKKITPTGGSEPITASIGIALFPNHGKTYLELYNNADVALYRAKELGRNCNVMFERK